MPPKPKAFKAVAPPTPPAPAADAAPTALVVQANKFSETALRELLAGGAPVGVHLQLIDEPPRRRLAAATLAWAAPEGEAPQRAVVISESGATTARFVALLRVLLVESPTVKALLGVHAAAHWLAANGLSDPVRKCVDLQLFYEHLMDPRERDAKLLQIARHLNVDPTKIPYGDALRTPHNSAEEASLWTRWPLPRSLVQTAVAQAQTFAECYAQLRPSGVSVAASTWLQEITERRWSYGSRYGRPVIWFDVEHDYLPRSIECLGAEEHLTAQVPLLDLQCEIDSLLLVLPTRYRQVITAIDGYTHKLVDVCLDVGRVPHAYVGTGQRVVLESLRPDETASSFAKLTKLLSVSDENGAVAPGMVTTAEIKDVLERLGGEAKIGSDNRAGIDRQLHRISVMRSKTDEIYGLTLRVGRTLQFASNYLLDLLMSAEHRKKSVLLLGRPGSGKTTLIRDIARCISESGENVCIIDTSNEIGGDGLVPHECVGLARRMMVKSLDEQASVMIECVQNHTVETLIVDEIGRKAEVNAAGTVRQRGPRMVASAHGDFRSLIKNQDLKGLVGGVQSVTVGDQEAKKNAHLGKVQAKRAGNPIFDVIVEIDEVHRGRCRIIWDVAEAVDEVLSGNANGYKYETRFQAFGLRGVQVLDKSDS